MAENVTVTLRARVRWWVRPYLSIAIVNSHLGIPVDFETVAKTVVRGVRLWIVIQDDR
jgi:hypothetical protein